MRVSIPHDLGREEVRRRMRERINNLGASLPGLPADVEPSWQGDDRVNLNIQVMGQSIDGFIEIEDHQVWVDVTLPMMLAMMEPMIQNAVREQGTALLQDQSAT